LSAPGRSFSYRRHEKFYVVECDGERPHEAEFIAKWLKPEVSIWVSLGRSHAVFYEGVVASGEFETIDEAIAHEFATIPTHTRKLVLIDGDNQEMVDSTKIINAEVAKLSKNELQSYE
jgi:UDP-N-acetylmuramyl pentapeptide synthase